MKIIDRIKLEKAQNEKFKFKIEDYLRTSFSIYSKCWVQFSFYTLLAIVLFILSSATLIGPYIIYYPLLMGICNVTEKIENDENIDFKDFFVGFNKWTRFLGLVVLIMVVSIGVFLPYVFTILDLETEGLINTTVGLYSLAFLPIYFILMIVFSVVLFMAPYILYFDDKISLSESLRLSYLIAKKNFWTIFLFMLFVGIISQFGFYICFVGVLITIPLSCIMTYLFVKNMLLVSDQELNNIVE